MEESNQKLFYQILCNNSENKNPKLAILEWDYIESFTEENHCICGHFIKENCLIRNKNNLNELIVGNSCIKKFLNLDYKFLFKGLKSIQAKKIPNKSFIAYCFNKGYIYDTQKDFLIDIFSKKKLTEKQELYKEKILFKLQMRKRW